MLCLLDLIDFSVPLLGLNILLSINKKKIVVTLERRQSMAAMDDSSITNVSGASSSAVDAENNDSGKKMSKIESCLKSDHVATVSVFMLMACDDMTISFFLMLLPQIIQPYYCETFCSNSTYSVNDDVIGCNVTYKKCDDVIISQHVGLIAGIGPVAEVIANPLIGYLVTKLGTRFSYRFGWFMMTSGVLVWLLVSHEWGLFVGRVCQSVGSTVSMISGLSYLGERFRGNEPRRIRAFSRAYIGCTFGFLMGYIVGSLLY